MENLTPTQKKIMQVLLITKECELEVSMTTIDMHINKSLNEVPRKQEKLRRLIFNHTAVANELNEVRSMLKLINL